LSAVEIKEPGLLKVKELKFPINLLFVIVVGYQQRKRQEQLA
jgi:hypothetical protein